MSDLSTFLNDVQECFGLVRIKVKKIIKAYQIIPYSKVGFVLFFLPFLPDVSITKRKGHDRCFQFFITKFCK